MLDDFEADERRETTIGRSQIVIGRTISKIQVGIVPLSLSNAFFRHVGSGNVYQSFVSAAATLPFPHPS